MKCQCLFGAAFQLQVKDVQMLYEAIGRTTFRQVISASKVIRAQFEGFLQPMTLDNNELPFSGSFTL